MSEGQQMPTLSGARRVLLKISGDALMDSRIVGVDQGVNLQRLTAFILNIMMPWGASRVWVDILLKH